MPTPCKWMGPSEAENPAFPWCRRARSVSCAGMRRTQRMRPWSYDATSASGERWRVARMRSSPAMAAPGVQIVLLMATGAVLACNRVGTGSRDRCLCPSTSGLRPGRPRRRQLRLSREPARTLHIRQRVNSAAPPQPLEPKARMLMSGARRPARPVAARRRPPPQASRRRASPSDGMFGGGQASIGPGRRFGVLTLPSLDRTMPGSSPRRGTQAVNEGRL